MSNGLKISGGIIVVLLIALNIWGRRGLENKDMLINPVDLSKVKDGTFDGEFKAGRFSNKVQVSVKEHKITDIKITKDVVFHMKSVEDQLISEVIKQQKNNVDVVAGGTVTTKSILKSVENALQKGLI